MMTGWHDLLSILLISIDYENQYYIFYFYIYAVHEQHNHTRIVCRRSFWNKKLYYNIFLDPETSLVIMWYSRFRKHIIFRPSVREWWVSKSLGFGFRDSVINVINEIWAFRSIDSHDPHLYNNIVNGCGRVCVCVASALACKCLSISVLW